MAFSCCLHVHSLAILSSLLTAYLFCSDCSLPMHMFASVCICATWTFDYAWPLPYMQAPLYMCLLCLYIWEVFAPHEDTSGFAFLLLSYKNTSVYVLCVYVYPPSTCIASALIKPCLCVCVCTNIYDGLPVIIVCFLHTCGGARSVHCLVQSDYRFVIRAKAADSYLNMHLCSLPIYCFYY